MTEAKRLRLAIPEKKKCAADFLNDACWLKIFKHLHLEDLLATARVNKKFKNVSMTSFKERFGYFSYPYTPWNDLWDQRTRNYMDEIDMRKVLLNFGHLIKSMCLRDRGLIYVVEMDIVSKYCAGTLEELNVLGLNAPFCDDLVKPLFESLKVLEIYGEYFYEAIKACKCLNVLRIVVHENCGFDEMNKNIPTLKELHISCSEKTPAQNQYIKLLLQSNSQIKKLSLNDCNVNETLCIVAPEMLHLEELRISRRFRIAYRGNLDNIIELGKLSSLKRLEFNCIHGDAVRAIVEAMQNVPLEHFKWARCPSNLEFMESILKLKTLKSLALTGIISPIGKFQKLAAQLPLLEEFEFEIIDDETREMRDMLHRLSIFGQL
ncbi:hypothetical protein HA402_016173 [Bradysia odoriphaga]|nr:hypothetical protein HA402_016173 [Bradysia odoriphaga]